MFPPLQAAISAVEAAGKLFPLPVVLHHIVPSLIACLGSGPDVAVALVHVASSIGGTAAARHILPSLLALLISGAARTISMQQPLRNTGLTGFPKPRKGVIRNPRAMHGLHKAVNRQCF